MTYQDYFSKHLYYYLFNTDGVYFTIDINQNVCLTKGANLVTDKGR